MYIEKYIREITRILLRCIVSAVSSAVNDRFKNRALSGERAAVIDLYSKTAIGSFLQVFFEGGIELRILNASLRVNTRVLQRVFRLR